MDLVKYAAIVLLLMSCSSKKEIIDSSSLGTKNTYLNRGLQPIEFSRENEVFRIWIDRSSSITDVLTIVRDTSGNYAEYISFGHSYKRKRVNEKNKIGVYDHIEVQPVQGWTEFNSSLDLILTSGLTTRKNDPSVDGMPIHRSFSKYFVEWKYLDSFKRFEFFSFYPSQYFPEDMAKYKELEKLILTSFEPLLTQLKRDQDYYKAVGPFEY